MNKILKLAVCTGILSPLCASAQLISVDSASPLGAFDLLIAAMAVDEAALGVGNGEANATTFSQVYWDNSAEGWVTGSLSNEITDLNFQLVDVNPQYFIQTDQNVDIGFIGNENWDLDELYINAYAVGDVGNSDPRERLFQYSDNVAANNVPGDTARLSLTNGTSAPVVLEFEHINQTSSPLGPLYQSSEIRFNMFQAVSVVDGQVTGFINDLWLWGINDKNDNFDADGDDGYFLVSGVNPVPEPSQIAALSLVGLAAFLFVRRRLLKRGK